jgi:hypothetical protein
VVERPRVGDRCFISHFTRGLRGDWITWRPGRALRWKVEDRRLGRSGSVMSKPAPPRLCPPPRLCHIRTDGLAPVRKYWTYRSHAGDMGPVSLVAGHQQKNGFAPTTSMTVLGEKLGMDPWIGHPACCGLYREPFFSGAVAQLNSVDVYTKNCYALTAWDTYSLGPYADWAWEACGVLVGFSLQGVHRFKSPRLSDMSNRLFTAVST